MVEVVKDIVKRSELFWNLTDDQIDKLVSVAFEETFAAGQQIFAEGQSVSKFYIINKGKINLEMEIHLGARTQRRAVVDVLEAGSCCGWSALLGQPAAMSATALEPVQTFVFESEKVRAFCDEDTELGYKVMCEISNLASKRLSMARLTLAQVLSFTSHDLRAPLATVQSSIDVITCGFAGEISQKQRDLLQGSKQRIVDLLKMIDNILDISYIKLKATDFMRVDLYQVVEAAIDDVSGPAKYKAITLRNDTAKRLSFVLGSEKRLQQVFTNLIGNGIKFTPNGGSVTVSSRETADRIQIDVSDTGIGIPPEDQPKLFSDFFRGGRVEAEGAGLGLSIAKRIVEGHSGTIWVQSPDPNTGIGTRFSLALPKVLETTNDGMAAGRALPADTDVLVVDDDPEMREITTLVLQSQGYKVRTAQDGADALTKIVEKEPDLLILDLLMPRLDGFEVCKWIEEKKGKNNRSFPIIVLSAVREDNSRRRYALETDSDLGVDDYVVKPISPPLLLQTVEKVMQKKEQASKVRRL